ncbi:MAG: hypothetical protein KDD26_12140 [Winogradskyella sp.]|nr:hypothetical protein [Winogradskyella sp.]
METIEIIAGEHVKLNVKISSDANAGSNVSLNDKVVKKSITNNFNVDLGEIEQIDDNTLSVVSNFFVLGGNIDAIIATTHVINTISSETSAVEITSEKVKISPVLFMAYIVVKFKKV